MNIPPTHPPTHKEFSTSFKPPPSHPPTHPPTYLNQPNLRTAEDEINAQLVEEDWVSSDEEEEEEEEEKGKGGGGVMDLEDLGQGLSALPPTHPPTSSTEEGVGVVEAPREMVTPLQVRVGGWVGLGWVWVGFRCLSSFSFFFSLLTHPPSLSLPQRKKLTKEGYKLIGSHSAVKLCR